VVQLEKYFDFSLLSLTSLLSAPEREVTSPSDFKVVEALHMNGSLFDEFILIFLSILSTVFLCLLNTLVHRNFRQGNVKLVLLKEFKPIILDFASEN
jgi:hypothetical protein